MLYTVVCINILVSLLLFSDRTHIGKANKVSVYISTRDRPTQIEVESLFPIVLG